MTGVCGGIAESLGCKPWVVRVQYAVASVMSAAFPGLLVYALLYVVMPGSEISQKRRQ